MNARVYASGCSAASVLGAASAPAYASWRFARACSRSRTIASSTPLSRRTGSSARNDSMASFTCARSRCSGETRRKPIDAAAERAFRRMSATPTRSSASRSCSSVGRPGSSATDRLGLADLLRVDLAERRAPLEALDLPLGGVLLRNGEIRGRADLFGCGKHPVDELLDPLPRGDRLAAPEVDELSGQPPPDRAPEVLLDQPVRE